MTRGSFPAEAQGVYSWDMQDDNVFIHCSIWEKLLHPHAALLVRPNQAAFVNVGGKFCRWVYENNTYSIGLGDQRTIEEILAARAAGESGISEVQPEVYFFDLRDHRVSFDAIKLPAADGKVEIHPTYIFRICDPEILMRTAFPKVRDIGMDEQPIKGITAQISSYTRMEVEKLAADMKNRPGQEMLQVLHEQTNRIEEKVAGLLDALETGFLIEKLEFNMICLPYQRCPQCDEWIEQGARSCPNGHPLYWCPTCKERVEADWFSCRHGHELLWCGQCGKFILPVRNRFCPEGHGACYPKLF